VKSPPESPASAQKTPRTRKAATGSTLKLRRACFADAAVLPDDLCDVPAAGRRAAGRFEAADVVRAGVCTPARFLGADLRLPAAGGLRAGFACFLTMIILVPYGAARPGRNSLARRSVCKGRAVQ
jgi:hypothetical protein